MKAKVNTYFAILLIVIAGAGATLVIVRFLNAKDYNYSADTGNNEASYQGLQQDLLNQKVLDH